MIWRFRIISQGQGKVRLVFLVFAEFFFGTLNILFCPDSTFYYSKFVFYTLLYSSVLYSLIWIFLSVRICLNSFKDFAHYLWTVVAFDIWIYCVFSDKKINRKEAGDYPVLPVYWWFGSKLSIFLWIAIFLLDSFF